MTACVQSVIINTQSDLSGSVVQKKSDEKKLCSTFNQWCGKDSHFWSYFQMVLSISEPILNRGIYSLIKDFSSSIYMIKKGSKVGKYWYIFALDLCSKHVCAKSKPSSKYMTSYTRKVISIKLQITKIILLISDFSSQYWHIRWYLFAWIEHCVIFQW